MNATSSARGAWETFTLVDLDSATLRHGDHVQLRTSDGVHYLAAEGGGGSTLVADRTAAQAWETFVLERADGPGDVRNGDAIGLQTATGHWVVAESGGGGVVGADRTARGPWETFQIELESGAGPSSREASLRTQSSGEFVGAQSGGGGQVTANADAQGPWETFTLFDLNSGSLQSGDRVQLRTTDELHYLSATGGGGSSLLANSTAPDAWETFVLERADGPGAVRNGDAIGLQTATGHWVVAEGGGGGVVNANRTARGPWETFLIGLSGAGQPPLPDKREFVRNYQGNFGSIKVPGCGLFNDSLFDPILLVKYVNDRPCYEKMMQAHAERGDNRVVVDPRADYHGGQGGGIVDWWHEPAKFAEFLDDIRSHVNNQGENFEALVFLAGDGHIGSFIQREGVPDLAAEAHWADDLRGLAAVAEGKIAGTATCWECRHQRDYITPGGYERAGKLIAQLFPSAWHGEHLIQGSSSWSSWRCDPQLDPSCPPSSEEGDDPNRGNEPRAWTRCVADGWCDGLLYQFEVGGPYLNPSAYPNYTGYDGAMGRYWEVVVRLGNDPQSIKTSGGDRHGWVQADLLAFEHIYDAYNNRSTEAYGIEWCKKALAVGGWGCGSASYRRDGQSPPPPAPLAITVSGNPTTSITTGQTVTWTASATGGTAPITYKFYLYDEGAATWSVIRDWSTAPAASWTPLTPGAYHLQVWAKNAGSTKDWDAYASLASFTVTAAAVSPPIISADRSSPVPLGVPVTFTAQSTGGTAPLQYRFWVNSHSTGAWTLLRDYSPLNTYVWTPPAVGDYHFQVWVRSAGSTKDWDSWAPYPATGVLTVSAPANTNCPAAVPNDGIDDSAAINACLARGGTVTLAPWSKRPEDTGYTLAHGLKITVNGTRLTSSTEAKALLMAADSLMETMVVNQGATSYEIDHLYVDGREYTHTRASAFNCVGPRGEQSNFDLHGDGYRVHDITSAAAPCGSGLNLNGSNYRVYANEIVNNGTPADQRWNSSGEPWADGITIGSCYRGQVYNNLLQDNSDVDLIIGGGSNCSVTGNLIRHYSRHAFAGLMTATFASADHSGGQYNSNTVQSFTPDKLDIGILIGAHPWNPGEWLTGITANDNTSFGAFNPFVVDGVSGATIQGNNAYGPSGTRGLTSCVLSRAFTVADAVSSSIQGGSEPVFIHGGNGDTARCGYADAVQPESQLHPDQAWDSSDGAYHLVYQGDGNLVLYDAAGEFTGWASWTQGSSPGVVIMQGDGNLVIYSGNGPAIWQSSTAGNPGASLRVQPDGHLVIYNARGQEIRRLW